MSIPRVPCPCCKATGKVDLSLELQETLKAVPKGTAVSTLAIKKRMSGESVKHATLNNRLRLLEDFKLIANTAKRGRWLFWRRIA